MEIRKKELISHLLKRKKEIKENRTSEVESELLSNIDVSELFPPGEHGIYAYYGRIGQGKTYAMTADIIEALNRGQVVYTNYPIEWNGYDERKNPSLVFLGLLGLKWKFYNFSSENLQRIEIDENFQNRFSELTDCIVAIDEGYVVFDSYEMAKMSLKKRKNVLHTRHFDRSIWYTTQRPTNIHAVMRANTNVFYKVRKLMERPFVVFKREEYDMAGDDVNEKNMLSKKWYFGKSKIFRAYDTKYLRAQQDRSQNVMAYVSEPRFVELLRDFLSALALRKSRISRREVKNSGATINTREREPGGRYNDTKNDEIPF